MGEFAVPPLAEVAQLLCSPATEITERMRALFYARHLGGPAAAAVICGALAHPSVLYRHEAAYVLGQMGEVAALPTLERLLRDGDEHSMVRHEAAEALAALGQRESLPVLEEFLASEDVPVRETCEIGVASLRRKLQLGGGATAADTGAVTTGSALHPAAALSFSTVDPMSGRAAATPETAAVAALRTEVLDASRSLAARYEALFTLRNVTGAAGTAAASPAAAAAAEDAVIAALEEDRSSALFRHEVAFVLGQIQTPKAARALMRCLADASEHPMARHEAALALGSVLAAAPPAAATDASSLADALKALQSFATDPEPIVAESCLVALRDLPDS